MTSLTQKKYLRNKIDGEPHEAKVSRVVRERGSAAGNRLRSLVHSYMIPESDLELGQFRLLDVDNKVVVPTDTHVRLIVTGADVIHSFAVPSLGIKIDAVPGRLNQTSILCERTGTFYGQCSEICGVWHGFMPIAIEAVSVQDYLAWVDAA